MNKLVQQLSQEIAKLDGVKTKTSPQKISFTRKSLFASIVPQKDSLTLEFITPSQINHARMKQVKKLKPNKFLHTISIKKDSDIDPQVTGWIMIAHATN